MFLKRLAMPLLATFDDATAASLSRWWHNWKWKSACVRAIVKGTAPILLEGGADVRRPGGVHGW